MWSKSIRNTAFASLALLAFACGGDSSKPSDTTQVRGFLIGPPPVNCQGCSTTNAPLALGFFVDGNQEALDESSPTGANGVYVVEMDSENLGAVERPVIVAYKVNDASTPAAIGGAFTISRGRVISKDFTPTTHVACAAIAVSTGIDNGSRACANLFDTLPGDNLETAADAISATVRFPGDVDCASCALNRCLDLGKKTFGASDLDCIRSSIATCTASVN
jgi:hypothetical protein